MKVRVGSAIEHKDQESGEVQNVQLSLHGVCDDSPENKLFWDATPSLTIETNITNVAAVPKDIKVGDLFYVDFTPAQE
jgi:hypothetical protein